MDKPGFVRLTVNVLDQDGKPLSDLRAKIDTSVGFDVTKIPEHPAPSDLEAFWTTAVTNLLTTPHSQTVDECVVTNVAKGFRSYRYSVTTRAGERPATGLFVLPDGAAASSCVLEVGFDGYGFGPTVWPKAEPGTIVARVTGRAYASVRMFGKPPASQWRCG